MPIPDTAITAIPARPAKPRNGSGYGVGTRSDRDGRFVFRDLSPSGEWILDLRLSGYRETVLKVTTGSIDVVVKATAEGGPR